MAVGHYRCRTLVIWAIVSIVFQYGSINGQDLIAMFIGPGCFGSSGNHALFRHIATLAGIFLFSALLFVFLSQLPSDRWYPLMSQFLRISRLIVSVLSPISSPISLRPIDLSSNISIVNRCSLVRCLYPFLCRFFWL